MKMRILLIAIVLTVCVQGAVFAKGIIEERNALSDASRSEADQILERVPAIYEDARYGEAVDLLQKNKELFMKAGDQYYAKSVSWQGLLYFSMKDYVKAETCYKELCDLNIRLINQNFSSMSEERRGLYMENVLQDFEACYSLSLKYPTESLNGLNYNNAMFTKGLLLRTAVAERARASSSLRDMSADAVTRWQDVQNSLRQGEAAVEFVSFNVYDVIWTDTVQYAALVIKQDSKAPVLVQLCDEEKLQNILGKVGNRSSYEKVRILYNSNNGRELYDILWKPLEKELTGVTTVYYSPSGLLHKIAFNALPIDDSFEKRLADKYNLSLVSGTREIVRLSKKRTQTVQINSAVLYGGLDYDADEKEMRKAAQLYKKDTGVTRGMGWNPLPGTLEEVLAIQKILKSKKIPNTLYKGSLGNEESFKNLDGKKTWLIHLATNSFYIKDIERNSDNKEQRYSTIWTAENPMLRSGIILAGVNHAWTNKPIEGVEDGILFADEIANLNLFGTELVTLSGCESMLGDIHRSEGVYGLQRAFKLAGVNTLIMSLWEVDDKTTSLLMSVFYKEWLVSGKSMQEALKEAQNKVRAKYPGLYYWAAFVIMD